MNLAIKIFDNYEFKEGKNWKITYVLYIYDDSPFRIIFIITLCCEFSFNFPRGYLLISAYQGIRVRNNDIISTHDIQSDDITHKAI